MGIRYTRLTEYDLECDLCGKAETVYTGDSYKDRFVSNIPSAIFVADFHKCKGKLICGNCFRRFPAILASEEDK